MEVLLNATWFLASIVAFLFWRRKGRVGVPPRREDQRLFRGVALACALILLFPSISLTDDLHSEQAVMEDSSRSVMKARDLAGAGPRAARSSFPALLGALPGTVTAPHVIAAKVVPLRSHLPGLVLICPFGGRAPPSPQV